MFNPRLYARKVLGAAFATPFYPFRPFASHSSPYYTTHSALSAHRSSSLFVSTSRRIPRYPSHENSHRNFTMQAAGSSASTTSKQTGDDPKEKFLSFLDTRKTVVLATTSPSGEAHASAVPFVHEDQLTNLYVFVSDLSEHTAHLRAKPRVSALLVADESETSQLFARTRSSFECDVVMLERGSAEWEGIVDKFAVSFGSIITVLRDLEDFRVFKLTPTSGRFVMGFGKAFDFDLDNWPGMKHIDPSKESK